MENYKNNTLIENFDKDYYSIRELKKTKNKKLKNFYNTLINNKLFLNYYNQCKSISKIIEAGYFTEKYPFQKDFENIFITPFNKLNLKKDKINYILLTTGGFSPIHDGHINMLNQSKLYLEKNDFHVAGGYISPSHDDYVLTKRNQNQDMNIYNRINIINNKILDSNWLMVDQFEGMICKSSVNYTKIYYRLEKYLKYHFKKYKFKIVFCYGTDNKDFSKLFEANNILSICVNRDSNIINNSNNYTKYIENYYQISSTEIRKNLKIEKKEYSNKKYYLRDDLDYLNIENEQQIELINIFNKYINNIKSVKVKDEKKIDYDNIISLDIYFKGKYNINYSRLFNLCDGQIKSNKMIDRIGYINNIEQIDTTKEYILVDDDISSGFSIKYIKNNILNKIKVIGEETIIDNSDIYDVNDLRDFIIGSNNGGLSCELPNKKIVRVPYIFPYIDLYNRSTIEYENIKLFSKDIIEYNKKLYGNKKIEEFNDNFILFLEKQGYKKEEKIANYFKDLLNIFE